MRRGAKRAARSLIQEASSVWASINAIGKVMQLAEKHEWLLKAATTSRTVDTGCQTMDTVLEVSRDPEPDIIHHHPLLGHPNVEEDPAKGAWIQQNGVMPGSGPFDISSVGLGKLVQQETKAPVPCSPFSPFS